MRIKIGLGNAGKRSTPEYISQISTDQHNGVVFRPEGRLLPVAANADSSSPQLHCRPCSEKAMMWGQREPKVEQALAARQSRINRHLIISGFVATPKLLSTNGTSEPSSTGTPEDAMLLASMWELARYTESWLHASNTELPICTSKRRKAGTTKLRVSPTV